MQISPINDNNCTFKGLWGNPDIMVYGNDYHSAIHSHIDYFPFKDETDQEIDIYTGRKRRINIDYDNSNSLFYNDKETVDVCGKLSFTKSEFNKYKQKMLQKESNLELKQHIENELKRLKMDYYLNDYVEISGYKMFKNKLKSFITKLFK